LIVSAISQNYRLESDHIYLRPLGIDDSMEAYQSWFRDAETVRYISGAPMNLDVEELRDYVRQNNDSDLCHLFGIFDAGSDRHIGNIRLTDIDRLLSRASVGILVGSKEHRGQGMAGTAIRLVTTWAHDNQLIKRVFAGCHEENVGSVRAFTNAGFVRREQLAADELAADNWTRGIAIDHVMMVHLSSMSAVGE
jgi:ribosomal-protein-alanine N-acetyltransferase